MMYTSSSDTRVNSVEFAGRPRQRHYVSEWRNLVTQFLRELANYTPNSEITFSLEGGGEVAINFGIDPNADGLVCCSGIVPEVDNRFIDLQRSEFIHSTNSYHELFYNLFRFANGPEKLLVIHFDSGISHDRRLDSKSAIKVLCLWKSSRTGLDIAARTVPTDT